MTKRFVYLPADGDPYLFRCWLDHVDVKQSVWVITDHDEAQQILNASDAVYAWERPDDTGTLSTRAQDALAHLNEPSLVLPQSIDQVPMRYRPNALMANVVPHFPLIRQASRWGFRNLTFVSHRREERVSIPWMLDDFHNRHAGQRCFVVGNGPSLNDIDMSRLKDEITLGSNRCFLGYETWGYPFTYWGVYDKYQIETYHPVYEKSLPPETVKFFPLEYALVLNVANGCPLNITWPAHTARAFSAAPDQTHVGFTVTYMLLQIAATMGCDPIVLVGADHRYDLSRRGYSPLFRRLRRELTRPLRGGRSYETILAAQRAWKKYSPKTLKPALWSTKDAKRPTHFTAEYTASGKNTFLPPEPEEAERDFDTAQDWAVANQRSILNATPNTALKSFPLVDFETLF